MVHRRKSRKRPCRICRKWFSPHPRVGDRQKTCGAPDCKKQWHTRKCSEWNRKHRAYFQENYLSGKLQALDGSIDTYVNVHPPSLPVPAVNTDIFPQYPRQLVQEVIGTQQVVIIDYIGRLLFRSVKEVIKRQHDEITIESKRLLPEWSSRSDSVARGP